MRQFFMVVGAMFVIIAGVSPIKRVPSSGYRLVEVSAPSQTVVKSVGTSLHTAVRVGAVPGADLP